MITPIIPGFLLGLIRVIAGSCDQRETERSSLNIRSLDPDDGRALRLGISFRLVEVEKQFLTFSVRKSGLAVGEVPDHARLGEDLVKIAGRGGGGQKRNESSKQKPYPKPSRCHRRMIFKKSRSSSRVTVPSRLASAIWKMRGRGNSSGVSLPSLFLSRRSNQAFS